MATETGMQEIAQLTPWLHSFRVHVCLSPSTIVETRRLYRVTWRVTSTPVQQHRYRPGFMSVYTHCSRVIVLHTMITGVCDMIRTHGLSHTTV